MYISAGHYIRFAGSSISSVLKSLSKTPPHSPSHSLGYLSAIMHLQGFPDSSVGKESTCNAGDPGSIPGSICWRRDRLPTQVFLGFPCGSAGKESTCIAGDPGSIPGLGRSPGEGKGYPLQCSGLENSMDCTVHGVTKSQTRLSDFHFTSCIYMELYMRLNRKEYFSWLYRNLYIALAVKT